MQIMVFKIGLSEVVHLTLEFRLHLRTVLYKWFQLFRQCHFPPECRSTSVRSVTQTVHVSETDPHLLERGQVVEARVVGVGTVHRQSLVAVRVLGGGA